MEKLFRGERFILVCVFQEKCVSNRFIKIFMDDIKFILQTQEPVVK